MLQYHVFLRKWKYYYCMTGCSLIYLGNAPVSHKRTGVSQMMHNVSTTHGLCVALRSSGFNFCSSSMKSSKNAYSGFPLPRNAATIIGGDFSDGISTAVGKWQ